MQFEKLVSVTSSGFEVTNQDNLHTIGLMILLVISIYLGIKLINKFIK